MRKRMGKIRLLSMSVLLLFILAGCNRKETAPEEKPEVVTLDWYINFSWFHTPWGENVVSKKITEETGVNLNFIVPSGNESEKLDSMISSNTLPDIVTLGWWENQAQVLTDLDLVYALNELAEEYEPYFFQVVDPATSAWYTHGDGNLYCYPNSSFSPADYEINDSIGSNQNFLVRKDIYEAIGSPDMTTEEGFKNAVKKAVEMFPEVDGKPLIPIGADEFTSIGCNSFDKYLFSFLAVPYEEDGKLYDRYTDPDYISWLKTFRQLNEEGYLKQEIFIDKRVQLEEKAAEGRYFCMLYQGFDLLDQQKIRLANDPDSIYIAIDGPKNSAGDDPTLPGTGINGWTITFISKNCKDPQKAIEFLTYLISEEGQKRVYLGVEGVTYDMVEGKPELKPEVQELLNRDRGEFDRIYGADDTYWMLQDNVMQLQWEIQQEPSVAQFKEWTYPYTMYTGQYDVIFEEGSEEANIDNNIKREWSQTLPRLLLAGSEEEFDQVLNHFIDKRDKMGFNQWQEASDIQMKLLKNKLGMEQE